MGFHAGSSTFCCCVFVDNVYAAGDSAQGAVAILDDFEEELKTKWQLNFKPSSRCVLAASGRVDEEVGACRWPQVLQFPVLGHILSPNGSIRPCWQHTKSCMWRGFFANVACISARNLGMRQRQLLINRSVCNPLDYRCSRWPPQPTVALELDTLQRRMLAIALRPPRLPGEEVHDYCQRRGALVGRWARAQGLWSRRWFSRSIAWDDHLSRPRNNSSWAARLRLHMDRDWFISRRAWARPGSGCTRASSALAGATRTRSAPGKVFARWHDGIAFARAA